MSFTILVVAYLLIAFIVMSLVYVKSFWPYHVGDTEKAVDVLAAGLIWPLTISFILLLAWLKFLENRCKNASK